MKCPKCNRADLSDRGSCAQCGYREPNITAREARQRTLIVAQKSAAEVCARRGFQTAQDCIAYCRETLKLPRAVDRATIIARWRSLADDPHAHQHARALARDALIKLAAFAERTPGEDDA